jgi:hypothetical protein
MKDVHAAELAALINNFTPSDLADVLHLIAERIGAAPAIDDFQDEPLTQRQRPAWLGIDRMELQKLVHRAYHEAGFVVLDVPDGTVGILNASPQIVTVTNRILELLVDRFGPKAQR